MLSLVPMPRFCTPCAASLAISTSRGVSPASESRRCAASRRTIFWSAVAAIRFSSQYSPAATWRTQSGNRRDGIVLAAQEGGEAVEEERLLAEDHDLKGCWAHDVESLSNRC